MLPGAVVVRLVVVGLGMLSGLAGAGGRADAQERRGGTAPLESQPEYQNSPYHGQIDGNGNPIPCRCRFQGEQVMLGTVVCMETPSGRVLTRCDLRGGNTSWVPSETACEVSEAPAARWQSTSARASIERLRRDAAR